MEVVNEKDLRGRSEEPIEVAPADSVMCTRSAMDMVPDQNYHTAVALLAGGCVHKNPQGLLKLAAQQPVSMLNVLSENVSVVCHPAELHCKYPILRQPRSGQVPPVQDGKAIAKD